jgi:hypothetical protein
MVRRVIALLVISSTLLATFSHEVIFVGFQLNKIYIATTLCINKARPWMHCNGKCYFMKKIRQANENGKKQSAKDSLNRLEISFFLEPFRLTFIAPVQLKSNRNYFPAQKHQYASTYIDAIFIPPIPSAQLNFLLSYAVHDR